MVAGILPPTPAREDPNFLARWKTALEALPNEERALKQKIMDVCFDIEKKIAAIQSDLRDSNVIMARTVGRSIEFEMNHNG